MLNELLKKTDRQLKLNEILVKEVAIAHRARMDKWNSSNRSREESSDFKTRLVAFYDCAHSSDDNLVKCLVLNQYFPKHTVIASHIWKHATEGEGLTDFNLKCADVSNVRNGLLMCKPIEQAFDVKGVCFLIDRLHPDDIFIKVLNPHLQNQQVHLEPGVPPRAPLTFANIDGNKLNCPNGNIPFRRILDFHAKCSFERARRLGWIDEGDTFDDFWNMSVGASIPDLNFYQNLDGYSDTSAELSS